MASCPLFSGIPLKRDATQAGLDNAASSHKKRRVAKSPFIMDDDDELDLPAVGTAVNTLSLDLPPQPAIVAAGENSSSPRPPSLPSSDSTKEKSASQVFQPETSPLSELRSSQVISQDQFTEYEKRRNIDQHNLQVAEECVYNALAKYKDLNNGKLSLAIYNLLRDEVLGSVYSNIPCTFQTEETAIESIAPATYTSADALTQTEQLVAPTLAESQILVTAAVQPAAPALAESQIFIATAIEPDDTTTVTIIKPTSSDASTQTKPLASPAPVQPDWATIYNKDLETIRMKQPFVTGKYVVTIKTALRRVPRPTKLASAVERHRRSRHGSANVLSSRRPSSNAYLTPARKASAPVLASTDVISLDSDDDDDDKPAKGWSSRAVGGSPSQQKESAVRPTATIPKAPGFLTQYPTPVSRNSSPAADPIPISDAEDEISSPLSKKSSYRVGDGSVSSSVGGGSFFADSDEHHGYSYGNRLHVRNGHEDGFNDNNYDHDHDGGSFMVPPAMEDTPQFYGLSGNEGTAMTDSTLRFQDRKLNIGCTPDVNTGHRLKFQEFLAAIGADHMRDPAQEIEKYLKRTWGTRLTLDEDTAIAQNWCSHESPYSIVKGFPLVEDVEFIVPENRGRPDGDCYWRSISFSLYGTDKHWDIVKAEHLSYVYHALKNPSHSRHELYSEKLNKKFFLTAAATRKGEAVAKFYANMWQVLYMAHAWTPALMQQVTADLYNICLITFTRAGQPHDSTITETAVRGSFNSRHIFLQFVDQNHFQPMCPNQYRPSEFRYPRVTVDKTAKYDNAPKATSNKSSLQHPWRNDFTKEVPAPVPHLSGCDVEGLRRWLGTR
ncbi:putative OTU domain-containing protein [Seiridium cardinale]|uniref:OTU domain-containing protein n=1 Tax=Seiridium cardinale TaxID=138064 RepID=A0ABR2XS79_9PEZI